MAAISCRQQEGSPKPPPIPLNNNKINKHLKIILCQLINMQRPA